MDFFETQCIYCYLTSGDSCSALLLDCCNDCCCAGHIEHGVSSGGGGMPGLRQRGAAASFLENKGFGWLMEVADEDEDQKPLLYYGFTELLLARV